MNISGQVSGLRSAYVAYGSEGAGHRGDGRWRHEGRRIELANVKAKRLIFSLNGGQALRWRSGRDVASAIARCGSVSVAGHGINATLEIHGRDDTLQILIEPVWLERSVSVEGELWSEAQKAQRRLALCGQALVALTVSSDFDMRGIVEGARLLGRKGAGLVPEPQLTSADQMRFDDDHRLRTDHRFKMIYPPHSPIQACGCDGEGLSRLDNSHRLAAMTFFTAPSRW